MKNSRQLNSLLSALSPSSINDAKYTRIYSDENTTVLNVYLKSLIINGIAILYKCGNFTK